MEHAYGLFKLPFNILLLDQYSFHFKPSNHQSNQLKIKCCPIVMCK